MRLHNWSAPGLSRRSSLTIGLLGITWRPATQILPVNKSGVRVARMIFAAALAAGSPTVPGTRFTRVSEVTMGDLEVRGEWVHTVVTRRTDGAFLYIHGSGHIVCSSRTHRGITSHLSADTGLPVFSIDYRLAPTHTYPAASDDVRAAWEWLLSEGFAADRIVIGGDSAGGHLAIALAHDLAAAGLALPAAIVAISPFLDLSLVEATVRDRIVRDPFAAASVAKRALTHYADEGAKTVAARSFEFDTLSDFPPILIHAGSREMLGADCTELARRIRAAGFDVEHRVWPGQMHAFQVLSAVFPEGKVARTEIAEFLDRQLPRTSAWRATKNLVHA